MLSIDDLFEIPAEELDKIEAKTGERPPKEQELVDFYCRLQRGLGVERIPVTIEPKIDGVAVSLVYGTVDSTMRRRAAMARPVMSSPPMCGRSSPSR
jgi:NAD-dependent DNA ligase